MKISSRKAKGRRLQYIVCEEIAKRLGIKFNQKDDLCPIHSREMGQSGSDIVFRDKKIYEILPFSIECKNSEIFNWKFFEQAKQNKLPNTYPALIYKKNRMKPLIILELDDFLDFAFQNKTKEYQNDKNVL